MGFRHLPLSHRALYNTDWVKEGCPLSDYDADSAVDNSVWTFTLCYAVAALSMTMAILLLALSSSHPAPTTVSQTTAADALQNKDNNKTDKQDKEKSHNEKGTVAILTPPFYCNPDTNRPYQPQSSLVEEEKSAPPSTNFSYSQEDTPSIQSWKSPAQGDDQQEDSLPYSAVYLEDGTLSTNPTKDEIDEKEAPSEPAVAVLVTNPPPLLMPPKQSSSWENTADLDALPDSASTAANSRQLGEGRDQALVNGDAVLVGSSSSQQPYEDCYMTFLVCYFMFLSTSKLVSGFGHMTEQDFAGKMPNRVIHGTAAFAATSLFAVAATEYVRLLVVRPSRPPRDSPNQAASLNNNNNQNARSTTALPPATTSPASGNRTIQWMLLWMMVSLPALVIFVILDSHIYTNVFLATAHCAVLLTALFRICFCHERHLIVWYSVDAMAMLIYFVGFLIQAFLEEPCGAHGYEDDCFANCPFSMSTSDMNHNSIFYLCLLISLFLYGCSKMIQLQPGALDGGVQHKATTAVAARRVPSPHQDPRVAQGDGSSGGSGRNQQQQPPPQGHHRRTCSGAAAAILLQDQTVEV